MRFTTRAAVVFAAAAMASIAGVAPASAITADLAKKCRDMAIKAVPTALAGKKTSTARDQRTYYTKCVDAKGDMPAGQVAPPPTQAGTTAPAR